MSSPIPNEPDASKYYAHGKLLLSGEYFVMDGSKALAIPTCFGQHLEIHSAKDEQGHLFWTSLDEGGNSVLSAIFEKDDFRIIERKGAVPHYLLQDALRSARNLNKDFLSEKTNIKAVSRLEFSMGWGLGSSSTLIQNIASWAKVNPFDLFFSVLQGSGYDVACASAASPIVYRLSNSRAVWDEVALNNSVTDNLVFIYLGNKQNSQQAVMQYRDNEHAPELIPQISAITERMAACDDVSEFIALMKEHENVISSALRLEKVQDRLFSDFPGAVKSLGAWGGDFVMALSINSEQTAAYFIEKGYTTVFPYRKILFGSK